MCLLQGCQASLSELDLTGPSETLLLLVEPPLSDDELGAWQLYDSWGALRIDLAQSAGLLAADYERIYLGVPQRGAPLQSRTFMLKDEAPMGRRNLVPSERFIGMPSVQSDIQVLVWADGSGGTQRLIGLSTRGERLLDMTLEHQCSNFILSFSGAYVFGQLNSQTLPLDDRGLVIDVRSQSVVWMGAMRSGTFLHDDSGFLVLTPGTRDELELIELPSGVARSLKSPSAVVPESQQSGLGTYLVARATTAHGVLFKNYGNVTSGQFLWWLTPDERWVPVGGAPQLYAKETLIGALRGGRSLIFERSAMPGRSTQAQLGIFEFDLQTELLRRLSDASSWLSEDHLYFKEDDQVYALDLAGARSPFGPGLDALSLPTPQGALTSWKFDACAVSYQGGFMAVCAQPDLGPVGAIPPDPPDWHPEEGTLVYQNLRALGVSLPAGTSHFSEAGRALFVQPSAPELQDRIAILALQSEAVRWIETTAKRPVFLYPPDSGAVR